MRDVVKDIESGSLTKADKIVIGCILALIILGIIFFITIIKTVKANNDERYVEQVQSLKEKNISLEQYAQAKDSILKQKNLLIGMYQQRDSISQIILRTDNLLINKLNAKDKTIVDRIANPSVFPNDSLLKAINDKYRYPPEDGHN
jgi:hypothetical protein